MERETLPAESKKNHVLITFSAMYWCCCFAPFFSLLLLPFTDTQNIFAHKKSNKFSCNFYAFAIKACFEIYGLFGMFTYVEQAYCYTYILCTLPIWIDIEKRQSPKMELNFKIKFIFRVCECCSASRSIYISSN